jgi:hypothetical protein
LQCQFLQGVDAASIQSISSPRSPRLRVQFFSLCFTRRRGERGDRLL